MGTPEFARTSLDHLIHHGYQIVCVVTAPDKLAGRGMKIQSSAVKLYAENAGIPVLQPVNLKDPGFLKQLKGFDPGLIAVVAFRILPEAVFNMPPAGTVNLHASLLPDYRGAAPINWAIINGEKTTGVTTFFIEKDIDAGRILLDEKLPIGDAITAGELHDQLMHKGASLLRRTIDGVMNGSLKGVPQKTSKGTKKAPKIRTADCRINWTATSEEIFNLIRGLSPSPAAWTILNTDSDKDYQIKVFLSERSEEWHRATPGSVITDHRTFMKIAAKDGYIHVRELQLAGKKRMGIGEFLKGFRLQEHWNFI